jgi:hypothetical protein
MSCASKLCVFNAYHEQILMFYGCFLQLTLCVVDACYKRSYVLWLLVTNKVMYCGCMLHDSYVFWMSSPSEVMCCGRLLRARSYVYG